MSKALSLAREFKRAGRRTADFDRASAGLSVQESSLLSNAIVFLEGSPAAVYKTWPECEEVARKLDEGGVLEHPFYAKMAHVSMRNTGIQNRKKIIQNRKKITQDNMILLQAPGVDDISAETVCRSPLSELTECSIRDLLATSKGSPAIGRYVNVKIVAPSFQISSIQCCVEDEDGTVISLSLYNFVPLYGKADEVENLFPIGTLLTIKHPYLKLSNHGNLALRVDNPVNVVIALPHPPPLPPASVATSLDADALKTEGNSFFASGDHSSAIDRYSKGLAVSDKLHVDLHANRAASRLRMVDFEGALADCTAVLAVEPTHAKALMRRDQALQGLEKKRTVISKEENLPEPPSSSSSSSKKSLTVSSSPEIIPTTSDVATANMLKTAGNASFKANDHPSAIDYYTKGLAANELMKMTLLANRAASQLLLGDFTGAIADCDAVLSRDPTHAKALARKEKALSDAQVALRQKEGVYNFLTLPYNPDLQNRIENYFGPIEIRSAGAKGRGLFVTRDVRIGELLFVEKAIICKVGKSEELVLSTNFDTKRSMKGSTAQVVCDLVMLANKDPSVNAQLSYLAHDLTVPNPVIPSMKSFREARFEHVPVISAKQVAGAVSLNVFSFSLSEPSRADRQAMEASHGASVDAITFLMGHHTRTAKLHNRKLSEDAKDKDPFLGKEGTALWIVGSFMNHGDNGDDNTAKDFFGKLMVVHAKKNLKAGDEITTLYSGDKEALETTWGIFQ